MVLYNFSFMMYNYTRWKLYNTNKKKYNTNYKIQIENHTIQITNEYLYNKNTCSYTYVMYTGNYWWLELYSLEVFDWSKWVQGPDLCITHLIKIINFSRKMNIIFFTMSIWYSISFSVTSIIHFYNLILYSKTI